MKNQDYSKKILKILSENRAVALPDLADKVTGQVEDPDSRSGSAPSATGSGGPQKMASKARYAINRSVRGLQESGLIESHFSGQQDYALLTPAGRKKVVSLKLESDTALVNLNWDGFWRMIILDLPESRKSEREALRYLLKKAGFVCIKNSVWVTPHPFEHLFINIKKDLGLSTELMIVVTSTIDPETESELLKAFGK